MNTVATFPTYRDARLARVAAIKSTGVKLSETQIMKHGPYGYEFGTYDMETHYTIRATSPSGLADFDLGIDGEFHGRN